MSVVERVQAWALVGGVLVRVECSGVPGPGGGERVGSGGYGNAALVAAWDRGDGEMDHMVENAGAGLVPDQEPREPQGRICIATVSVAQAVRHPSRRRQIL